MSWRGLLVAVALALVAAACSDSTQESPATAPPTTVATTAIPTTTVATTAPTSTTAVAPTPEEVRLAEIEAIFRDLEYRRLDALYRNDEEAFRALFANEAYLEQNLDGLTIDFGFLGEPTFGSAVVAIEGILVDRTDCIAADVSTDYSAILRDTSIVETVAVLTLSDAGEYGYAFAGTGWLCDGPHPLEG